MMSGWLRAAGPSSIENNFIRIEADEFTGSYALFEHGTTVPVLRAAQGAQLDARWIHSSDYPTHAVKVSEFQDALGSGRELTINHSGLANTPGLICTLRLYNNLPFGTVQVQVMNSDPHPVAVQAIRTLDAEANPPLDLGGALAATRVLSDSFSEDRPVLQIRDMNDAANGMHRAVGSQLLLNRESGRSLFLGALSSNRFLTLIHLKGTSAGGSFQPRSYTVDSTGTTEILRGESLSESPPEDQMDLSLPLAPGESMDSEPVMLMTGRNYHQQLETYGAAIRRLHGPRPAPPPLIGWWSWTVYYFGINEAAALTNAEWMGAHLKDDGYVYVHLDEGYDYARGEYSTPDASHFPHGLAAFSQQLNHLGLKLGLWTAPFEVSERSWVYQNHKDWLVQNAAHRPIHIGHVFDKLDQLYVLDTTNPAAQAYLQQTYRTLSKDWHVRYIKMDFMDDTAIEGRYYRPNTTGLEAQRIGLKIIRESVGDGVVLDKDGSPMLNTVGLVDTGRLSADTGHAFEVIKDAASGIAARYYMNRNFFVADPDAYSVSKELVIDPDWHKRVRSMTLSEAQAAITLAAVAGGMFELGDDLPALGKDPERVALVRNRDLLDMIRLGRSAKPLDLLTYEPADEQPSIFLLRESPRQSILAVFNWTDHNTSHRLTRTQLGLSNESRYEITDVFSAGAPGRTMDSDIQLNNQSPHSVRVLKMIDLSAPPSAPLIVAHVPQNAAVANATHFSAEPAEEGSPAVAYHWKFDDGISADGNSVSHAFTTPGGHSVQLHVEGLDGVPYEHSWEVNVTGTVDTRFRPQNNQRYTPETTGPR